MSGAAGAGVRPFKAWSRKAALRVIKRAPVAPIAKWHIVAGDLVYVRSGRSAGKTGKVKEVLRKQNRVIVEGANLVKRHVRATTGTAGGVVALESPVHYSNVNLVDPTTGKPTRVAIKFTEAGGKVRVSKRSGAIIPWPELLKSRRAVRPAEPGVKDTDRAAVQRVSYTPPAELLPYLRRGGALFKPRRAAGSAAAAVDDRVPQLFRDVRLRRKDRNKLKRKWAQRLERSRLSRDIDAMAQQLMAAERAAAPGASGAGQQEAEMR